MQPTSLKEKARLDNKVMKVLRVNEIRHILCHTDKGDLCLTLEKSKTDKDYQFILDAVPVDKDVQKDLFKLFNYD